MTLSGTRIRMLRCQCAWPALPPHERSVGRLLAKRNQLGRCHNASEAKNRPLLKDIVPIFWAHDEPTRKRKSRFPLMRKML